MRTELRTGCWWWRAARRSRIMVLVVLPGGEVVGRPAGAARGVRLIETAAGTRLLDVRDVLSVRIAGEGGVPCWCGAQGGSNALR